MDDLSIERKFKIGDLVVFSGTSAENIKNQIGIIIGTQVVSAFSKEYLMKHQWYVAQFGTMKLIVNDIMITKLEHGK